jgi:D-alanyl-D-alanine carboxypeptidase
VVGVRRTLLLLASVSMSVLLASGAALAVTPVVGDTAESIGADATTAAEDPDAALDSALEELVAMEGGPPGIIAIVQRGDHEEVHAFGVADLEDPTRLMSADDRMRVASTAKAFSGAVALSLVSKGRLSLDDRLGDFVRGLPRKGWRKVTLRQLLQHTSGLPDFTEDDGFRDYFTDHLTDPQRPRKLLSYAQDKRLRFEPGSKYHYSNSDNIAVGLMVEGATGGSYEDQLEKRVYGPLSLQNTSLPRGADLEEPYIRGYDLSEDPPEDVSELVAAGWAWASGGVGSTPADLNAFVRGYVGGELFGRETRRQQREVLKGGGSEPPGPGKNSAGLGVFRYETRCGTVWGHTGNTFGYTQFMASSPNGRRSVTVSINAQITTTVGDPEAFKALRRVETLAVCAALARKG